MSLVFLKIPRPPSSPRLVKKTECQQDSSDSLLNFPFQISHFNFPNWIATSGFNSFQADHSFSDWVALSGFQLVQIFNWLSRPFRFSTQPSLFFFIFFFRSFHHAFESSKFVQNRCKIRKDNLVKSIVDFNFFKEQTLQSKYLRLIQMDFQST